MPYSEERVEPLIDCATACRILGMKKTFVYDLATQGRLPSYRIGRSVRFKLSDLREFVEARRQAQG